MKWLHIRSLLIGIVCILLVAAGIFHLATKDACPTGYVPVPGSATLQTEDFCVMAYEAQKSEQVRCNGTYCPVSKPNTAPWNFASVQDGLQACRALGKGYDLISDAQWMTIANNIAQTPINDIDDAPDLQLATGNTSKLRQVLTPSDQSASVTSCNLNQPLSSPDNAQCSLRTLGYTGTEATWEMPYLPGLANKSQNRLHALSNGSVLWDFAGNLWEWTRHPLVQESKTGTGATFEEDSDGLTGNGIKATKDISITQWIEYEEVADYGILTRAQPTLPNLSSKNGSGKISLNPGWSWDDASNYTTPFKAIARGGAWANTENGGIYALDLALGPSYQRNYTGFRCVTSL